MQRAERNATRPRRVLVTGAAGFVGRHLCATLGAHGHAVHALVRTPVRVAGASRVSVVGDLVVFDAWREVLADCDAVIHLAALTHASALDDSAAWPRFVALNVDVTRRLAAAACAARVRNFVFLSSIKVNGERSPRAGTSWHRFSAADPPRPEDHYGRSKRDAEDALAKIAAASPMRVCVLRPPLLYGPGMKGNLPQLLRAVARRRPLPLASVRNCRSLLAVGNLVAAIEAALARAPRGICTYTLADVDLSTPELVRALAAALGVAPRLWPCPVTLLRLLGALSGRRGAIDRLTGSLVVERAAIATALDWQPSCSFEEVLLATARAWREEAAR